jgi:peptide/nickel transport system permease protein
MTGTTQTTTGAPATQDRSGPAGIERFVTMRLFRRRQYRGRRGQIAAVAFLILVILGSIFGPAVTSAGPLTQDPNAVLRGPSLQHWLGTDGFGRDVLARLLDAGRVSLSVAAGATVLCLTVGVLVGLLAGAGGKWADELIMRLMDVVLAFPAVILAVAIVVAVGAGLANVILIVAILQVPVIARVFRSSVLVEMSKDYVAALSAAGLSRFRLWTRHIVPNAIGPSIALAASLAANAILVEASLSFLGLGITPPTPTWGNMLSDGRAYILTGAWWLTVFPGVMIFLCILALNVLADALAEHLDPAQRGRLAGVSMTPATADDVS